jgi:hypothetical protein
MALGADVDPQLGDGRAGLELLATRAAYGGELVLGVDALLHGVLVLMVGWLVILYPEPPGRLGHSTGTIS